MDLGKLLDRCRDGDELAWEALVRQYQARILGLAYHYLGNREEARDLAQEVFIRIYRNIHLCKGAEMFMPWVIRIARNLSIDHKRRKAARPIAGDIPVDEMGDLPAPGRSPEAEWMANSRKRLIFRALQELTDINREIILLKEIQGLTLEEIASLLKVPLGTVKSRANRARIELAEKVLTLSSPTGNVRRKVWGLLR
jgi:RNA polymerase sigma-70 factor (ECF subfamily)